ncbi:nuclear transport factor 2 family protein [Jiangella rhizosphaerae]|uniref:Nuclear transport factor 2 family protein n=1 Tax=Jiangella rhizosphaerae TaxID=2293569 RepID=A0A418KR63_9ACTN|nr:nuclear transport factor 2 family protein [Jiangella rhizosphaerae]RIQ23913.1 nuclear transport factor 2 family protein [Jiangella rhizosphaerae]
MTGAALDVALAYHHAWAGGDLDAALRYIADDVLCEAPPGLLEGVNAYRAFLEPYVSQLVSASLIAAFGDDEMALVMYDSVTQLVARAPGAECVRVAGGRIVRSWFVFDRAPFMAARAAMVGSDDAEGSAS